MRIIPAFLFGLLFWWAVGLMGAVVLSVAVPIWLHLGILSVGVLIGGFLFRGGGLRL